MSISLIIIQSFPGPDGAAALHEPPKVDDGANRRCSSKVPEFETCFVLAASTDVNTAKQEDMTEQAGCWTSLRALFRGRNSTQANSSARQNKISEPAHTPAHDLPPKYESHPANKQNVGYRSFCCDWSPLEQEPLAGYVGKLELPNPEAVDTSDEAIEQLDSALRDINLKIHDHPELGWDVEYAHDILTDFLEEHGFTVTRHYLSDQLPGNTAWKGEFTVPSKDGSPLRVVGLNSEMDALPGIGHACGHNLIAVAGVAAALGMKQAMEKHRIPGKVIILGTPAEEIGAGKADLLKAGAYKDMDVCLMTHPGAGNAHQSLVGIGGSLALQSFAVEYHGQTAHAGAAPWEGRNALDAAFIAYAAISALRQQIHPTARVHGMIEGRDWAPNIIQDYAKMTYFVRAPSWEQVLPLRERVNKCFQAAALATSCTMTMIELQSIKDLQQNSVLGDDFATVMTTRYGRSLIPNASTSASTDFGNVTYELPAIHPRFTIPTTPGVGNHTPSFTAAARTKEAHENAMVVGKGLSAVGLRVLIDQGFCQSAKDAFEKQFPQ